MQRAGMAPGSFPLCDSMAGAASFPMQGYLFLEAFCAHASAQISARDQSLASQQELSTLLARAIKLQVLSGVLPPATPHWIRGWKGIPTS